MSRFNVFLHRTDERLALPKMTRSGILAEVASDLEDLFQHYLKQGLSEKDAAARAEEMVDLSDEALAELILIHSRTRGWADRLVRRAQSLWERFAMIVIVLYFVGGLIFDPDCRPLANLTGLVVPIALILLAITVSFVTQMVRPADGLHSRRHREGLSTPLILGIASLVFGFLAVGIELYGTLMQMAAAPEQAGSMFGQAVLVSTSTLTAALLVALCAGVSWFVLAGRAARREDQLARNMMEVK